MNISNEVYALDVSREISWAKQSLESTAKAESILNNLKGMTFSDAESVLHEALNIIGQMKQNMALTDDINLFVEMKQTEIKNRILELEQ